MLCDTIMKVLSSSIRGMGFLALVCMYVYVQETDRERGGIWLSKGTALSDAIRRQSFSNNLAEETI